MEDELLGALYPLVLEEAKRRPRRKRVQYSDTLILLVALWAALRDRPICWACQRCNWPARFQWLELPSPATMSRRLRTVSLQLLLAQLFYRLLWAASADTSEAAGAAEKHPDPADRAFCLCRRLDSKPLPIGGFSKDRDARWGYATGGKYKGYKLFTCWARSPAAAPEAMVLGPMNCSDQAGGTQLLEQLQRLHQGRACGYLLADSTHDVNCLYESAVRAGGGQLQLLAPRKCPGSGLGHREHSPWRLRSLHLLEPPPSHTGASRFGLELYRQRGQIERDLGNLCSFGGGLQPLPSFVRRPRRVARWVALKLIINGMRICQKHGLAA